MMVTMRDRSILSIVNVVVSQAGQEPVGWHSVGFGSKEMRWRMLASKEAEHQISKG